MKLTIALAFSALYTHIVTCIPHPFRDTPQSRDLLRRANLGIAPYENGHRPRDISITIAQSLFEDPSIKSCVTQKYPPGLVCPALPRTFAGLPQAAERLHR